MMTLLLIEVICWLGWFCSIALAQLEFGGTVSGAVTLPALGLTFIGNIAVFITCLIRGRFDLEVGARDALAILRGRQLKELRSNGKKIGLTTMKVNDTDNSSDSVPHVIMLSNGTEPNSSTVQFMKCNAHIHNVHSMLLKFTELQNKGERCDGHVCYCIVFSAVDKITARLDRRMPGTLKKLDDGQLVVPCVTCLEYGCHGCIQGTDPAAPVCQILTRRFNKDDCICIPTNSAYNDSWTRLLIRSLMSIDAEARKVTLPVLEVMKEYLADRAPNELGADMGFNPAYFIVPRLSEVVINLVLTFGFGVDAFSSAVVARRTTRDYLVDSQGSGFAANAFLTNVVVKSNRTDKGEESRVKVCQVLTFRGTPPSLRTLSFIVACTNLICFIGWSVLIVYEGGGTHPPSIPIIAVIMASIGIALGMDCCNWWLRANKVLYCLPTSRGVPEFLMTWAVMVLEMGCIVSGSALAFTFGKKAFGTWVYIALQGLVWIKWGIGSFVLGDGEHSAQHFGPITYVSQILMYSSAFFLNAMLAAVRSKWGPWAWRGLSK